MKRLTDITLILDRSGSMSSSREPMEEALNCFLTDQQKQKDPCIFSLIKFDDNYEVCYTAVPIQQVTLPLRIEPRGATALHYAIGKTIDEAGDRFKNMPEYLRPDKVLFIIVTDGEENVFKSGYPLSAIFEKITCQRNNYKWEFMFIGADQDAMATAATLGISINNSLSFTSAHGGINNATGASYIARAMCIGASKYRAADDMADTDALLDGLDKAPDRVDAEYQKVTSGNGTINNNKPSTK